MKLQKIVINTPDQYSKEWHYAYLLPARKSLAAGYNNHMVNRIAEVGHKFTIESGDSEFIQTVAAVAEQFNYSYEISPIDSITIKPLV